MKNIENILEQLGLDKKEVSIYITSLKTGTCVSSTISSILSIPKSTVRYSMESLVKKGMMKKIQKGNATLFTAEHPNTLKNLLIMEKNQIKQKESRLNSIMGELVGLYNPYTKIPKVTFYEGIDGIQKVLNDSLTATEIIDSFTKMDSVSEDNKISEINEKYINNRIKNNIKKRSIYPDSEVTRNYLENIYNKNGLNDIKYLDTKYNLYISFMMYDGKISYITFQDKHFVGVIIQNEDIYNFHKNIFQFMWDHL